MGEQDVGDKFRALNKTAQENSGSKMGAAR
jgi:hypothetical protein